METVQWRTESPIVGNENKRDCSLLGTPVVPHEEAATCSPHAGGGRIVRPGLVSPGGHLPGTEPDRRAVWAALAQGGGL